VIEDKLDRIIAENAALREEIATLKAWVLPFLAIHAVEQARLAGTPNVLRPSHYDMLAECGARMDDFTRGEP
jgi:hypothetical protein